jgi:glutamine cyclotransferase
MLYTILNNKANFIYRFISIGSIVLICVISGCVPVESDIDSSKSKVHKYATDSSVVKYSYKIIKIFPHDPGAFTQGLVWDEGVLYEGTGLYGKSSLRKTKLDSGEVLKKVKLSDQFFGEGVTIFNDRIIQLSWRSNIGFVYDKNTLNVIRKFRYDNEGWGITHDGDKLIMSNGSANLYFLDPGTFKEIGKIEVRDEVGPVTRLNELEYIRGQIFANVWKTDRIAIIDPRNGQVTGWIDLQSLTDLAGGDRRAKTLNGIAYDKERDRLFVTGKLWPKIYEIVPVPVSPDIRKDL